MPILKTHLSNLQSRFSAYPNTTVSNRRTSRRSSGSRVGATSLIYDLILKIFDYNSTIFSSNKIPRLACRQVGGFFVVCVNLLTLRTLGHGFYGFDTDLHKQLCLCVLWQRTNSVNIRVTNGKQHQTALTQSNGQERFGVYYRLKRIKQTITQVILCDWAHNQTDG